MYFFNKMTHGKNKEKRKENKRLLENIHSYEAISNFQNNNYLYQIPIDLLKLISSFLTVKDMARFAQASKRTRDSIYSLQMTYEAFIANTYLVKFKKTDDEKTIDISQEEAKEPPKYSYGQLVTFFTPRNQQINVFNINERSNRNAAFLLFTLSLFALILIGILGSAVDGNRNKKEYTILNGTYWFTFATALFSMIVGGCRVLTLGPISNTVLSVEKAQKELLQKPTFQ